MSNKKSDVPYAMPSSVAKLFNPRASSSGLIPPSEALTVKISVEQIFISPLQYRCYVDPQEIESLSRSIQDKGLLEPIIVRSSDDPSSASPGQRYELAVGQKRLLAHQHLGLQTIEAKVLELTDDDLIEIGLIENNQRSQPNVWEETCGILKLLELRLGKSKSEVVGLLNRIADQKKTAPDNVIRDSEWTALEAVLASVSDLAPESFRVNRLPILNLPDDVQLTLRQGKLEYTKARAIAQVEDKDHRAALMDVAVQDRLSIREIRERVKTFKQTQPVAAAPPNSIKERQQSLRQITGKLKTLTPDKQRKFDKLLQQMLELISQD
ncbi:MAG: ParB/RepB/Spo0J family partition protein [Drouetiella hepatica Uher 2000/2452]|jgi:ParB family chromosome partitioning protein|uniref:ParB/RepB/Spo0J family partition protein n=1 Tax=Drouetiella hepatica Uher 2000/2452 TaxID=904376 RepID=A0A951QGP1_9CYAN|nr:ParB/RepB/Spo0J family partition protein [Drouetiella hepatica Uher 2000/2452]